MTHYSMVSNRAETACGVRGLSFVSATRVKDLVSCPECLLRVSRWTTSRDAAKAAWDARVASLREGC